MLIVTNKILLISFFLFARHTSRAAELSSIISQVSNERVQRQVATTITCATGWKAASWTTYTSYAPCCPSSPNYDPKADTTECDLYSACDYLGDFAYIGKKSFDYVKNTNLVSFFTRNGSNASYGGKTIRISALGKTITALVADTCGDSDCGGCCTQNAKPSGNLVDMEYWTVVRNFGYVNLADGQICWQLASTSGSSRPSKRPSRRPTKKPSKKPSSTTVRNPTRKPSRKPSRKPASTSVCSTGWNAASWTTYTSYAPCCPSSPNYDPKADTTECDLYSACDYLGDFAYIGKKSFDYVKNTNLVSFFTRNGSNASYGGKTIRISALGKTITALVADTCGDSDCGGCCTKNAKPSGNLVDMEYWTVVRNFGNINLAAGQICWQLV